jgi:hypothetical protein
MILLRHGSAKDDQDALPIHSPDQPPIPLGLIARQLMERVQPALPGLQAPLLTLHGGSHQDATQYRDHFPLAHRKCVIYGQWSGELRWACRLQGNWRIMGGYRGRRRQERDGRGDLGRSAIGRHRHGRDKAIPVTIPRLNEALRLPGVANGVAYGLETVINGGITDCRGRPYLFTEFMLGNHTVAMHQEIGEHLEYFRSQSN